MQDVCCLCVQHTLSGKTAMCDVCPFRKSACAPRTRQKVNPWFFQLRHWVVQVAPVKPRRRRSLRLRRVPRIPTLQAAAMHLHARNAGGVPESSACGQPRAAEGATTTWTHTGVFSCAPRGRIGPLARVLKKQYAPVASAGRHEPWGSPTETRLARLDQGALDPVWGELNVRKGR